MAISVIEGGNVGSFNALLFPEINPATRNYIEQQFTNMGSAVTDISRQFYESSKQLYDKVNDSNAIRTARSVIRMTKGLFHPNTIVELNSLEELRVAKPVMQRWIMAEPTIRELYHEQRCDGYSETYVDVHPGKIKDSHYDYRRVMDGIYVEQVTDEGVDTSHITTYCEDLLHEDRDLRFEEQRDIINTWNALLGHMSNKEDPTSVWCGRLD